MQDMYLLSHPAAHIIVVMTNTTAHIYATSLLSFLKPCIVFLFVISYNLCTGFVVLAEYYERRFNQMFNPDDLTPFHGVQIPKFDLPEMHPLPVAYSYSDTQFEILQQYIEEYQSTLDDEHEVGLLLTNFGQSVLMQVCEISYEESVLLIFKGFVNGKYSTLIQHVSQLNFLITSVEKEPDKPKRKIGFIHPDSE